MRRNWQRLIVGGELSPRLKAAMRERSGVYAIRRIGDREVLYVGQSHCGKLWRTMLRHFQAPQSFKTIGRGSFAVPASKAAGYEIAFQVTRVGAKQCDARIPKSRGDAELVWNLETKWIAELAPTVNREQSGEADADTDFDFGANVADDGDDFADYVRREVGNPLRFVRNSRSTSGGARVHTVDPADARRAVCGAEISPSWTTADDPHGVERRINSHAGIYGEATPCPACDAKRTDLTRAEYGGSPADELGSRKTSAELNTFLRELGGYPYPRKGAQGLSADELARRERISRAIWARAYPRMSLLAERANNAAQVFADELGKARRREAKASPAVPPALARSVSAIKLSIRKLHEAKDWDARERSAAMLKIVRSTDALEDKARREGVELGAVVAQLVEDRRAATAAAEVQYLAELERQAGELREASRPQIQPSAYEKAYRDEVRATLEQSERARLRALSPPPITDAEIAAEDAELANAWRLVVIGCGATKRGEASPARELYTGNLFRASRDYAEASGADAWAIASAKYGLLSPATVIEPYDEKLSKHHAREWGEQVARSIVAMVPAGRLARVEVAAPELYASAIAEALRRERSGIDVTQPLRGLGIGQRLAWFKQRRGAGPALRDRRSGQYSHGLEQVCARCGYSKGKHDAEAPYAQDDAAAGFSCDGFKAIRSKSPPKAPSPFRGTGLDVVRLVEAGFAHSLAVADAPFHPDHEQTQEALREQWIRRLPARGRWPERYVVTSTGSHALGSFDGLSDRFRDESAYAGELAREARKKLAKAIPAGYGELETKGKKAGAQLRLFANPRGALSELGLLTKLSYADPKGEIVSLRWSLKDAPILAHDDADRLFIVYGGRVVRSSSPAEIERYERMHWGAKARGKVRGGIYAAKPLRELGAGVSLTYTTLKGGDRSRVDYRHEWGDGWRDVPGAKARGRWKAWRDAPRIAVHRCGDPGCPAEEAIALVGGQYTVREHGVIG